MDTDYETERKEAIRRADDMRLAKRAAETLVAGILQDLQNETCLTVVGLDFRPRAVSYDDGRTLGCTTPTIDLRLGDQ